MAGWVRVGLSALVFVFGLGRASAQTVNHPPVEAFGRLPNVDQPQLSPDGEHVAMLQYYQGRPVLSIYTVGAPAGATPAITKSGDWVIAYLRWAKNDRVVLYLTKDAKLGPGYEHAGRLESWNRAVSVDTNAANPKVLFEHNYSFENNAGVAGIEDVDLDDPDHIFIPFYTNTEDVLNPSGPPDGSKQFRYDMYKVDVHSGDDENFQAGSYDTQSWFMDGHGNVVARIDRASRSLEEKLKIFDRGDWRDLATYDASHGHNAGIWGLSDDGAALVEEARGVDTRGFFRVDLASGKTSLLWMKPDVDVSGPIEDDWTGRIVGAHYVEDRDEYVYFDPEREALQRGIETAFPGLAASAYSMDVARDLVVVRVEGSRTPPTYYLLDRKTHVATPIGATYPGLAGTDLGEMKPYPYTARDGLSIPAYLTLPPGKEPKNLPTVIFPHGGPRYRDAIGFDWWAQFMANRGYAVLQPNFRGSSGYGAKFEEAGQKQWGLKMQDDITDGVKKLIADGIADRKRICIVGASYGGYAALAGATFTPDLYACAVSVAGVSDLAKMMIYDRRRSGNDAATISDLEALLGDEDSDSLQATSPVYHADQVKCPVLLLHGDGDTTVEIAQSKIEQDALEKAGKNVKFVTLEGDDHYLKLGTTRIQMLKEIETFLAANIGN